MDFELVPLERAALCRCNACHAACAYCIESHRQGRKCVHRNNAATLHAAKGLEGSTRGVKKPERESETAHALLGRPACKNYGLRYNGYSVKLPQEVVI